MPTAIEWTDETWNPIRARNRETGKVGHFCVHVSPGCQGCYAERLQKRFNNPVRYAAQDREKVDLFLDEKALAAPLRWRRPRMVFVCSMTDLFYEGHSDDLIDRVFRTMADAPQHTFQVLTKRPERMLALLLRCWNKPPLPNVWLGTSIEGPAYWARAELLKQTPAAVRFLSVEPLIENLGTHVRIVDDMDWVIVGGESGPHARPMHPDWARTIRDQCQAAGVPFFFKQWGEWSWIEDLNYDDARDLAYEKAPGKLLEFHSCGRTSVFIGKKAAGRLLDGRTWDEMPA